MHYYRFNIKDWTRDTAHLSVEEEGVYRRLLDLYYDSESPIPAETQPVIRRLRLAGHEEAVSVILGEFFELGPDGYRNTRCDEEIAKYHAKAEANRENGKKGGRPEKPKENPDGFEKKPTDNLNHKPLTTNHKPEDKSPCAQQADHDATFAIFWKLYPQKKARKEALKSWMKIKPTGDLLNQIMNGLAAQRASADWIKDGGQFVPHASTWLNNSRWEDEVRDGGDTRGQSQRGLSLVEQVAECNRQREQQEGTGEPSGAFASLEAIDGEFMAVDDEYVRTQMDFGSWPGRQ